MTAPAHSREIDGWVLCGCSLGVQFGGAVQGARGHAVWDALWGAVGGVRDGAGGCTIVGMFFAIWGLCWCNECFFLGVPQFLNSPVVESGTWKVFVRLLFLGSVPWRCPGVVLGLCPCGVLVVFPVVSWVCFHVLTVSRWCSAVSRCCPSLVLVVCRWNFGVPVLSH